MNSFEVRPGNYLRKRTKIYKVGIAEFYYLHEFQIIRVADYILNKFELPKVGDKYKFGTLGTIRKHENFKPWVLDLPGIILPLRGVHHLQNLYQNFFDKELLLKSGEEFKNLPRRY